MDEFGNVKVLLLISPLCELNTKYLSVALLILIVETFTVPPLISNPVVGELVFVKLEIVFVESNVSNINAPQESKVIF